MKETVILGLSGSPRKKGNTRLMVERALEGCRRVEGVAGREMLGSGPLHFTKK